MVNDDGVFASRKDLGLVGEVLSEDSRLPRGDMAVGHVRHGATGTSSRRNCQPIEGNHQKGHMAIAHNGNLSSAYELRNYQCGFPWVSAGFRPRAADGI